MKMRITIEISRSGDVTDADLQWGAYRVSQMVEAVDVKNDGAPFGASREGSGMTVSYRVKEVR